MTRCKYSLCATPRPLNALEQPMGWHIPCLNAKRADESREGWKMTSKPAATLSKQSAYAKEYYRKRRGPKKMAERAAKRTQRQEAG